METLFPVGVFVCVSPVIDWQPVQDALHGPEQDKQFTEGMYRFRQQHGFYSGATIRETVIFFPPLIKN